MADYRFSAKVISRGKGQSAIASAAYRAGARLHDERTGTTPDYSRKAGVLHVEVLAPTGTPDWMHDRAQLWNAVEAVERRKDAQLAREIQLSLPHELTDDQRCDLVRGFVQEQFVERGMIADMAIHAPSDKGDTRNHHAHVMLTMRELTGDGFGKKVRDWNSPDHLTAWREQWAHHQNRELKRHGHPARVDHRSFEAQGVDREPSQHLGPVAHDMEAKGKPSRIGDENREREAANTNRAMAQIEAARLAAQAARFETWAHEKTVELEAAQDLTALDLSQKHHGQQLTLEARLEDQNGHARATITAELHSAERRLEAVGVRKVLRDVLGRTRADQTAQQAMTHSLADIHQREEEQRQALAVKQAQERLRLSHKQESGREGQQHGIAKARAKAATEHAQKATQRAQESVKPPAPPSASENFNNPPQPAPEPSERLSLDDQKNIPDVHLSDSADRPKIDRPWRRASTQDNDNEKPWRRSNEAGGRHRQPPNSKEPK